QTGAALDLLERNGEGTSLPIRPVGADGVQGVDHREDPRADDDLLPLQPSGIAAAVPALLVLEDDEGGVAQVVDAAEHAVADGRMLLHLLPLLGGQGPGLEEDKVAHADLTDVVEER